jgi:hypothetical protein
MSDKRARLEHACYAEALGMTKLGVLEIGFVALGGLATWGGNRLSMPVLQSVGLVLLGAAFLTAGAEAMFTRRIAFARGFSSSETYQGVGAIFYGILFGFVGISFVAAAYVTHVDAGRALFLYSVRRPGFSLLIVGFLLLVGAGIALAGSVEERQGPRWIVWLNLGLSRLLPGLILVALGVTVTGLGVLEIVAPTTFDGMGGGFLEVLFGLE